MVEAKNKRVWKFRGRSIEFGQMPLFMGIVNVTPDSFSDGGQYFNTDSAVEHVKSLLEQGADIIDIGGESTRPGSVPVEPEQEILRIVPVIERIRSENNQCVISIDTRNAQTALAALSAGADIINDISGLGHDEGIAAAVAEFDAGLILMHMRGEPVTMQDPENLVYGDIVREVIDFLQKAVQSALDNKVKRENIVIDPGIGFSKDLRGNQLLLGSIANFSKLGYPVLVGPCRKRFIGEVLGIAEPLSRIFGTTGVAVYLAGAGADIIRVHDVKEIREAVTMYKWCMQGAENGTGCI